MICSGRRDSIISCLVGMVSGGAVSDLAIGAPNFVMPNRLTLVGDGWQD
jgi:hypothetical protein